MIQGHTFTALVDPAAWQGEWVRLYRLLHGLTAPMFLLGGGLAYGLVSLAHDESSAELRWRRRVRRRGLLLFILGYGLQVPRMSCDKLLRSPEALGHVLKVGPLQLVGACLLVCELLRHLTGQRRFRAACALAALAVSLVAPWVWQAALSHGKYAALGAWLDGHRGSLFPFVPWAAFFFVGVAIAPTIQRLRGRTARLALLLGGAGLGAAALVYLLYEGGFRLTALYGEHAFWQAGPLYFVFRTGLVLGWLALLALAQPLLERVFAGMPWLARGIGVLAKQSLAAYVAHLFILYGSPLSPSLVRLYAGLDLGTASLVFAGVMSATFAIAAVWSRAPWQGWARPAWQRLSAALSRWARRAGGARLRRGSALEVDEVREGERRDVRPAE
jgi:hypothetical protein